MKLPAMTVIVAAWSATLLAHVRDARAAAYEPTKSDAASDISLLVELLSDPVYDRRVTATRRLCALGQPALQALRTVADGPDREAALRAGKIIQALERVLFAGVEVRLESDRMSYDWEDPVEIRLILENRSRQSARVPFQAGSLQSESDSGDAFQVGAMIDAADWLKVLGPSGREVDLRVDEISDEPEVLRAVQDRLQGGPLHELPPGERMVVRLTGFNRGWARYPMLDSGEYRIALKYVPEWADPVLAQQRIGEVQSNELVLRVDRAAPDAVSRSGLQAELMIRREADQFIAGIVNRNDQAILVNTNYGVSAPFAEIQWVYEHGGRRETLPAAQAAGRTWHDFDVSRFIKINAGASHDLVRISIVDLAAGLTDPAAVRAGEGSISISYFNLCDKQWQMREKANLDRDSETPPALLAPLPRQLLSTRLSSSALRISVSP